MKNGSLKTRVKIIAKTASFLFFSCLIAASNNTDVINELYKVYSSVDEGFYDICSGRKDGFKKLLQLLPITITDNQNSDLHPEIRLLISYLNELIQKVQTVIKRNINKGASNYFAFGTDIKKNVDPEETFAFLIKKLQLILKSAYDKNDLELAKKVKTVLQKVEIIRKKWDLITPAIGLKGLQNALK
jgi:hypothetical protein